MRISEVVLQKQFHKVVQSEKVFLVLTLGLVSSFVKGILHQKIFYRLNLIFWIVMGFGIARFGRKGLNTTET